VSEKIPMQTSRNRVRGNWFFVKHVPHQKRQGGEETRNGEMNKFDNLSRRQECRKKKGNDNCRKVSRPKGAERKKRQREMQRDAGGLCSKGS